MRNSFWFLVLFSFILSFSHSYSQGIFLEKGEAGVFFNGGYSSVKDGYATSFGGGAAFGGVFEFDFTNTNSTIKLSKYGLGNEVEVNSNTVSFGVVLLKKKAQLEVILGFTTSSESSDALQTSDIILAGFNVGSEIKLHEKLSFYPMFSFAVGIPIEENSGNPVTALGVAAQFLIGDHVYVGPSFALSEGNFSWGVSAGAIISFNVEKD